ncbi:MAG: MOSC domain-containing protein [Paracoccaceae bacterium]
MTTQLVQITRHPIKGHGRENLASVVLSPGQCLPWDRHWAVAHEAAKLVPGWNSCVNFARGAKAPALMAISSALNEASGVITLTHPDRGSIAFRPDDAADLPRFLEWVRPLNLPDRAQPEKIVTAGRGITDSDFPSVSILSTATLADLSARIGLKLVAERFRGNLWLDGEEPWAEFGWLGREVRVGTAVLRIEERITRCSATSVDPETGRSDADTLNALQVNYGHKDFGVYGTVISGGTVAVGDQWSVT